MVEQGKPMEYSHNWYKFYRKDRECSVDRGVVSYIKKDTESTKSENIRGMNSPTEAAWFGQWTLSVT